MLSIGGLILLICRVKPTDIVQGTVFQAGMVAVVAIYGIAWLSDTYFGTYISAMKESINIMVQAAPWAFAFALFGVSVLINTQGGTVLAVMPLGFSLGKSGLINMDNPGQEILERSSMAIFRDHIEARFFMGLPASGRKIAALQADAMFFKELPGIVDHSLFADHLDLNEIIQHIEVAEDAQALRDKLDSMGLVAFVADGSLLPRASGIDSSCLKTETIIPFRSPESFRVSVTLPNRGKISGLGIPKGVTLILGGGYHGKSTRLNALVLGVYNHVPGDGREFCVTSKGAVKIRAADGRSIQNTDISPSIA